MSSRKGKNLIKLCPRQHSIISNKPHRILLGFLLVDLHKVAEIIKWKKIHACFSSVMFIFILMVFCEGLRGSVRPCALLILNKAEGTGLFTC